MKIEAKIIITVIVLTLFSFLLPLPFWSILWLDIVLLISVTTYDYRALLIVAILLMFPILFFWLSDMILASNRLTHFAFLWALMGIIKYMFAEPIIALEKWLFGVKDVLKDLYHEDDLVVNLVKESTLVGIITLVYVLADLFVNPGWWL